MRRLVRPGWLLAHAAASTLVVAFLLLGWWQVRRAAAGNMLSFGYAVQWPAFAGFVIYMWVVEARRAVRAAPPIPTPEAAAHEAAPEPTHSVEQPTHPSPASRVTQTSPGRRPARTGPAYDDSADAELAAYNDYLAWLAANPQASPAQYPGWSRSPEPRSSARPQPTGPQLTEPQPAEPRPTEPQRPKRASGSC